MQIQSSLVLQQVECHIPQTKPILHQFSCSFQSPLFYYCNNMASDIAIFSATHFCLSFAGTCTDL